MSFTLYPRSCYAPSNTSFTPLFRLLDDFESYAKEAQGSSHQARRASSRLFSPKFDVRETETAYELYGELPGIDRENISIEFTEPQTVVIRGRVERTTTSDSSASVPAVEDKTTNGTATDGEETERAESVNSRKATVEDDYETVDTPVSSPATSVAKPVESEKPAVAQQKEKAKAAQAEKYWMSERSIGQFHRTFTFPSRVEQDGVSASLSNGILTLIVPKAKKHEIQRVTIY